MFDPQIFTLSVVDPEIENGQESMSPYAFGFDNAVRYADPNGRKPGDGGGGNALPDDFVARGFFGVGMSVVNLVALSWAVTLNTPYKYQQNFVENNSGTAVDVETRKVPREGAMQDLKSAAWDVFNVTLAVAGGGAEGKLLEQASGKVAAAEIRATTLETIKPGSAEWKAAVKDMAQGGKTASNYRTQTATEAKNFLNESRGNMNRYKQYKGGAAKKGYEMHPNESNTKNAPHNDLQHVKWWDWNSSSNWGDGHIFFNKPN